jgi:hypothetical protein
MAPWLFPVTYAAHLLEEYLADEWFGAWAARVLGVPMSRWDLHVWNRVAIILICAGAALTLKHQRLRWIEVAMSIGVLGNALFHAAASAATLTYSPGLITAVVLWVPLAAVRLPRAYRDSSARGRPIGIWVGVSVVVLTMAVLASGLVR